MESMSKTDLSIAREVLRLRLSQMIVNEKYKAGLFKVPIHIAMGHEAIAIAVDSVMQKHDLFVGSHRNMHYNLARAKALKPILDEYLLAPTGLAQAELGSMNLANPAKNIVYSSSILGNNLPVATGVALGEKVKKSDGFVIVQTGDGAMEEGTFYESLLFARSNSLALLVIVENNEWSMHTRISERRSDIDTAKFAESLGVGYERFTSNDAYDYSDHLAKIRTRIVAEHMPLVLEVDLTTLGGWSVKNADGSDRFIHPHSGPVNGATLAEWPELEHSKNDPLFVLAQHFPENVLRKESQEILASLKKEIGE